MVLSGIDESKPYHLGRYVPTHFTKANNMPTDRYTSLVLDLKNGKEDAIIHFYKELDPIIDKDVAITYVPSSDPQKLSGLKVLAQVLAKNGRIDATSCIKKLYKTESRHTIRRMPNRDKKKEREDLKSSLALDHPEIIEGKDVLILDDIFTEGMSLDVCSELLRSANPKNIVWVTLAVTRY